MLDNCIVALHRVRAVAKASNLLLTVRRELIGSNVLVTLRLQVPMGSGSHLSSGGPSLAIV